ncbi:MAG: hypothetical protein HYY46_05315 [Deltaproteobacteria bacterium]|nr:hypothetical protein [Deltaproteobacteria bacterium]
MSSQEDLVKVKVGFNQQQRQLVEKLKKEGTMGKTDADIVRAVFVQWLIEEGLE